MQWATPSRILVFVPSMILEAWCAVRSMPFSACKLPFGTTKLELVTSGRSVWISLCLSGQYSAAEASTIPCPSAASRSASTDADRTALMAGSLRDPAGCKTRSLARGRTDEVPVVGGALALEDDRFAGVAARTAGWHAGRRPELAVRGKDRIWMAAAAADHAGLGGRMR